LSEALVNNKLSLDTLHELDDADARDCLMSIKGIGPWTANIYLLMALRRPDVWPSGDLAVKKAIEDIKDFNETPSTEEADEIALQWKPWRAVATRILWHHYLNGS
jgi:DNA-3-methyladenine glycosylase II